MDAKISDVNVYWIELHQELGRDSHAHFFVKLLSCIKEVQMYIIFLLFTVHQFQVEVVENLRSGILENIAHDNIALEINASK